MTQKIISGNVLRLAIVFGAMAVLGCQTDNATGPTEPHNANTIDGPDRMIKVNDSTVIFFSYHLSYQRTDTAVIKSSCKSQESSVTIPPDTHDPLTLSLPSAYRPAEDKTRIEFVGPDGPDTYPGATVTVPAGHRLVRRETHEIWQGDIWVEYWIHDVMVDESRFDIQFHPRYFPSPTLEPCHDQGGGT